MDDGGYRGRGGSGVAGTTGRRAYVATVQQRPDALMWRSAVTAPRLIDHGHINGATGRQRHGLPHDAKSRRLGTPDPSEQGSVGKLIGIAVIGIAVTAVGMVDHRADRLPIARCWLCGRPTLPKRSAGGSPPVGSPRLRRDLEVGRVPGT